MPQDRREVRRQAIHRIRRERGSSPKCKSRFFPWLSGLWCHCGNHSVVSPTLPCDPVIIIRYQVIQQPDFRHYKPWAALDGAQAALGTPAGNGVGRVAGEAGDLLYGQYVGRVGQLVFQMAAEEQAADDLIVEGTGQGYSGRLALGIVLIPPAGRSVMLRFGHTAAQIGGHVRLGDLVTAGALAGVDAGYQPALEQIQGSTGADVAGNTEVVAAHGIIQEFEFVRKEKTAFGRCNEGPARLYCK